MDLSMKKIRRVNDNKVRPYFEREIKQIKEPLSRSILNFATENEQPNVARVKLLLYNNSCGQMRWSLQCNDSAITIKPTMSGCIEKFGRNELDVIWRKPDGIEKWADAPQPKMQLFMKLFSGGMEINDAYTKFKAQINSECECTADNSPIHEVIFKSSGASSQISVDSSDPKSIADEEAFDLNKFLADPETLFWLIVILCCFLAAILLQSIINSDSSHRHNYYYDL